MGPVTATRLRWLVSPVSRVTERFGTPNFRARNSSSRALARPSTGGTETVVDDYMIAESPFPEELPWEKMAANLVVGDVETVSRRIIDELHLYRPSHMAIYFQVGDVPAASAIRSMELWAREVVPNIEQAFGLPLAEINRPPTRKRASG